MFQKVAERFLFSSQFKGLFTKGQKINNIWFFKKTPNPLSLFFFFLIFPPRYANN